MAAEETEQHSTEEHSSVPRVISGIAIIGLVLAGAIGVWTWQAGSEATAPKRNNADESTIAISTGAASQKHDVVPGNGGTDEPEQQAPPAYSTNSPNGSKMGEFNNVAPLGQDPYLPPNSWDGYRSYNSQPSKTIIAEGLNSRDTVQPQQQVQPSQQPAQSQLQAQPQTQAPKPEQNAGPVLPTIPTLPTIPALPGGSDEPSKPAETEKDTDTNATTPPDFIPSPSPSKATEPTEAAGDDKPQTAPAPKPNGESDRPTDTTLGPATTPQAER